MQDILIFIDNHWLLSTSIAVVLLLLAGIELIRMQTHAKRLTPRQATQLINRENAKIIDLRTPEAFATGHIVGSTSFPISQFDQKIKKIDKFKAQPLILVCASGVDSNRAANILQKQGFRPFVLHGGIRAWREAELPLMKD